MGFLESDDHDNKIFLLMPKRNSFAAIIGPPPRKVLIEPPSVNKGATLPDGSAKKVSNAGVTLGPLFSHFCKLRNTLRGHFGSI